MRPSRARVRKSNDTTPRARYPNSAARPLHFLSGLRDDVAARGFL
jgi:hypothetical protein